MSRLVFIVLCLISFLYQIFLNVLSRRSVKNPIPESVSDVYDEAEYLKWKQYKNECVKFDLVTTIVSFVIIAAMIGFNVFAVVPMLTRNQYLTTLYTILIFTLVTTVAGTVMNYYETFVIEEKFGFNKSTKKTFFVDTVKQFVINLVIDCALVFIIQLLYGAIGDYIILAFAAVLLIVILFVTLLVPYFSRLFNKFTPLENRELEARIRGLLEKNGIRVRSISVMNASLRTTKSNAYFAGMGKTKSIVLYDNLVNNFTDDEIVSVFAHEMGHAIHKDTTKNYFFSFGNVVVIVLAVWAMLKLNIYGDFGFDFINYGLTYVLTFNAILPILSPLMNLLSSLHSRSAEYKADAAAAKEGYGSALISALKKLTKENFADLSPDKTLVALTYSHPTIAQRIDAIEKNKD